MTNSKKDRIQGIYLMLLEMARGNLFYRLKRKGKDDDIEAVETCLNMLAEEMQEFLLHQSYANTKGAMKHIVKMCFILDSEGIIQMINKKTCKVLSYPYKNLIKKPFEFVLTKDSEKKWKANWDMFQQMNFLDTSLNLTFITSEKLVLPNGCHITTFKSPTTKDRKILVTVVLHSKEERELEKELKQNVIEFENTIKKIKLLLTYQDITKIRKAHEMMLTNSGAEFPCLKAFALKLGTNEFKLKYGFKELYGTSVHQFLINERLKNAVILIQNTPHLLKSIATKVGFKSLSHFSRTFKKKYGYTANALRKQSQKNN